MRREVPEGVHSGSRHCTCQSTENHTAVAANGAGGLSCAPLPFFFLILRSPQGRPCRCRGDRPRATAPCGGPGRARPHPGRHCQGTRARREKPRADPTEGPQGPQGPSGAARRGASRPRPSPAAHPAQADGPAPTGAGAGTKETVAQPPVAASADVVNTVTEALPPVW